MATATAPSPPQLTNEQQTAINHWSDYGRLGVTPTRRIHPWDWPNLQTFTSPTKGVPWKVPIHAHQLPLLLKGFLPTEMDKSPNLTALQNGTYQFGDWIQNVGLLSMSSNPRNKASEDKWFVYAEGPDAKGNGRLHMHRSWTGRKVFEVGMRVDGEDGAAGWITEIVWEPRVEGGDEEEVKERVWMVCSWVLGVDLEWKGRTAVDPERLGVLLKEATGRRLGLDGVVMTRVG